VAADDNSYTPWSYRPSAGYQSGIDLTGYKVAATDGDIGKVDQATEAPTRPAWSSTPDLGSSAAR